MSLPLISIIVPVYKVEAFLPRCVDSILSQTYSNIEVILVDDGSPDRCGQICDDYASRDVRVKVIHKPNGGLSSARNAGIEIASGEYITFVDSDDWVDIDSYERLYGLIEKYDTQMACAGRYDAQESGEETPGLCPEKEEAVSGEELASRIFRWENIDTAAWDKIYHRSLFSEIRYPVGVIGEDLPVSYRLALKAGKCALGNFSFYHYYHRQGSITTSKISERDFYFPESAMKIYEDICLNYPAIQDSARYLKTRALGWTVQMLDIQPENTRKQYAIASKKYRKMLRKEIGFILFGPYFSKKQRIDYSLISLGIYRYLRAFSYKFRKTKEG